MERAERGVQTERVSPVRGGKYEESEAGESTEAQEKARSTSNGEYSLRNVKEGILVFNEIRQLS